MNENLISRLKTWAERVVGVVVLVLGVAIVFMTINAIRSWGAADVQARWDVEKQHAEEAQRQRDAAARVAERVRDESAAETERKRSAEETALQQRIHVLNREVQSYARKTQQLETGGATVCALDADGLQLWNDIGRAAGLYPASTGHADTPAGGVPGPATP